MSATEGHWIQGAGGHRLWAHERRVHDAIGGVLLVHGYGEHSARYLHVIDALAARGFDVLAPDLRGHGRTSIVHGDIEGLELVISDLGFAADHLARGLGGRPLFVVAHSLGALFAVVLLGRDDRWAGAVLNGTATAVPEQVSRLNRLLARILGGALPWLPLQRFYDPSRSSRDPAIAAASLADPFQYKGRIRARTGLEVLRAIAEAERAAPRIRIPVLLTHGSADRTVPVQTSARLHATLGSVDKELHVFDGLLHEVHNEPERDAVLGRWGTWLARRARALG